MRLRKYRTYGRGRYATQATCIQCYRPLTGWGVDCAGAVHLRCLFRWLRNPYRTGRET